jgi:hypothetical protein
MMPPGEYSTRAAIRSEVHDSAIAAPNELPTTTAPLISACSRTWASMSPYQDRSGDRGRSPLPRPGWPGMSTTTVGQRLPRTSATGRQVAALKLVPGTNTTAGRPAPMNVRCAVAPLTATVSRRCGWVHASSRARHQWAMIRRPASDL